MSSGASAEAIVAAAISGGCMPTHNTSPHPDSPWSVTTSTIVAARCRTQPCENANGVYSGDLRTYVLTAVIFTGTLKFRRMIAYTRPVAIIFVAHAARTPTPAR